MKIGIFYGSSTGNTETAAELISENFSEHDCTVQDVSSIEPDDLLGYDFLILGISTWYVGEAQDDWIDLLDDMEGMDFNGVKFAIFGQGDQLGYPDTFQDGMGMVYERMIEGGGVALGFTSTEGYDFDESRGVIDDKFCGLSLDEDNQGEMTDERIESWCKELHDQL
tara:strand:+ start:4872 stop:5372 length:501 start_codon:yes stop_codon:yes gene_type:complete